MTVAVTCLVVTEVLDKVVHKVVNEVDVQVVVVVFGRLIRVPVDIVQVVVTVLVTTAETRPAYARTTKTCAILIFQFLFGKSMDTFERLL